MRIRLFSFFFCMALILTVFSPHVHATSVFTDPAETAGTVPLEDQTEIVLVTPTHTNSSTGIDATGSLSDPSDEDFEAGAVMLFEMNSNTMVYAKNIDERRYPASLTKVMTCLIALERGNLSDVVTVSEAALEDMDPAGSSMGLMVGEQLTLEQLLYGLMIASGNDAAPVIAEHIAGSEAAFIELMNQRAQELGCNGTHFANTHGLHNESHYSTARDMGRIMLEALKHDKFQEMYSSVRYEIPPTNLCEETRYFHTTNYLIGTTITASYYDSRVIGGKTGFTTPAGRCVMCTAERSGLYYLCVVMGAPNIETEDEIIYGSFTVASDALDLGFYHYTTEKVLSPLSPVAQVPVSGATQSVVLTPAESIVSMLPDNYDPARLTTKCILNDPNGLQAPLEAGQIVGIVQEYYDDVCIAQTDLVTVTAVEKESFSTATITPEIQTEEFRESPWRTVAIVFSIVLVVLVAMFFWAAYIRYRNRRRRRQRRRRVS